MPTPQKRKSAVANRAPPLMRRNGANQMPLRTQSVIRKKPDGRSTATRSKLVRSSRPPAKRAARDGRSVRATSKEASSENVTASERSLNSSPATPST